MEQTAAISPPKIGPLAGVAVRGMAWMSLVIIVTKLSSFAAQWALGVLLTPADFGIYALVTVAQNFIEGFRDIGASRILVQKGGQYDRLASPILKLSLAANAIAVLALVGGAPVFSRYYQEPQLLWLIPLTALAIPWTTAAVVYKAKASRDLNYKLVGKIEAILPLIQNGLMVAMAWQGFGVMSFVIPFAIVSMLQMIAYRRAVGAIPQGAPLTRALFWDIFHQSKWLMLGAYGMGLVLRGDYLVLGRAFENKADLGVYYFGFQLVASISILFTSGLQNVLMPAFSALAAEPARMASAFLRSSRTLLLVATLITGAFIAVCPEILQALWSGKWNAAVPVALAIAFSLPFKLLAPIGTSFLEAKGMWRQRTLILLMDGLLVCVSALAGAWYAGVAGAAVAIAAQRCLMGLFQACYSASCANISRGVIASLVTRGLLPLLAGLGLLMLQPASLTSAPAGLGPLAIAALTKAATFFAGWFFTARLLNREAFAEFENLIRRKLKAA